MRKDEAPFTVTTEYEVPFHDVDSMQIVWHGHYLKYMEIGRTALFRAIGLDMAAFVEMGYRLVVIDTRCRHTSPLRYGDRFRVESWFGDIDNRLLVSCEITNLGNGRRAARGQAAMIVTEAAGVMLLETPEPIRARILDAVRKGAP